jgi:hypothetical protein
MTGKPESAPPPSNPALLPFAAAMGENGRVAMPNTPRTFEPPFTDVPGAVAEIRAGRMVVVVDDEDRENEGDLTLAAEFVTPEAINFMARYGRGLICLTLTEERADYLRLFPMTQENTSRFGTAFTETIEAREGVTTGIYAPSSIPVQATLILPAPATYFRCAPARAACWCAPGKPRHPSIWLGWPVLIPPASSAKSCATTERWPAFPTSFRSARNMG